LSNEASNVVSIELSHSVTKEGKECSGEGIAQREEEVEREGKVEFNINIK